MSACDRQSSLLHSLLDNSYKINVLMTCIIYVFINFLEQLFVYNTGLIPSQFYEVLGGRDRTGFKHLLVSASFLILGTALVSKKRDICTGGEFKA